MSREDVCGKCGVIWLEHTKAPSDDHAFVEPTRAEAPQVEVISSGPPDRSLAEILRNPPRLHMEAPQGEICNVCDRLGPMACSDHAAAQPETVDGGRVREIVEKWCSVTWERSMGRRGAVEAIAREAYAAGRESVRTRIAERIEDMEAARRGGGR